MKLLYIGSWHTTQTWDDLTLFTELGIDWFDTGIYRDPQNPIYNSQYLIRGPIDKEVNKSLLMEFLSINQTDRYFSFPNLTLDFLNKFDLILYNYCSPFPQGIQTLVEFVKNRKPIIFRTYGHQPKYIEEALRVYKKNYKLYLVRNSPMEKNLPNYAGEDYIIRGYINENLYTNWRGEVNTVLTFSNDFNARLNHPNYEAYRIYLNLIRNKLPTELYGMNNSVTKNSRAVSWGEQIELFQTRSCYFNLNSPPASLTYSFAEALMTGIPVVSVGVKLGSTPNSTIETYEIPYIIENGKTGFYSDDPDELIEYIKLIMADKNLAKNISDNGRKKALDLFSKQKISTQWMDLFKNIK